MTEEEARTKWCPMVRFQIGPDNAAWQGVAYTNRGEELRPPKSVMCIASECMMWRWNTAGFKYCDGDRIDVPSKTTGYCGLGNKP